MWTKQKPETEAPAAPPVQTAVSPVVPFNAPSAARLGSPSPRGSARLGASLEIKGHITGTEDLQIDGKADGPISLRGNELTVGSTAQINYKIKACDGVGIGKLTGSLHATGPADTK